VVLPVVKGRPRNRFLWVQIPGREIEEPSSSLGRGEGPGSGRAVRVVRVCVREWYQS
jgi:hypothetical protein